MVQQRLRARVHGVHRSTRESRARLLPAGEGYGGESRRRGAATGSDAVIHREGGCCMSDLMDYVRAMAYGPSQGEFYHDALYGPLGQLQPGDIAISPNLLGKYPLGSSVLVYPENGNPFVARVADYSYKKPGVPTKDTIELWNGQDLGRVRIAPASLVAQQSGAASAAAQNAPITSPAQPTAPVAAVPATTVPATGGPVLAAPAPAAPAPTVPATVPATVAATAPSYASAGRAFSSALSSLGQSLAQGQQSSGAQAMAMLQRRSPLASYLQSLLYSQNQMG